MRDLRSPRELVSHVARHTGIIVSHQRIKYLCDCGILVGVYRAPKGHRRFTKENIRIATVAFACLALGLTTKQIKRFIARTDTSEVESRLAIVKVLSEYMKGEAK